MTVTVSRVGPNIMYSFYRWLRTYSYTVGLVTAPLSLVPPLVPPSPAHFADLQILPAYPDDLMLLDRPTLALGGPADAQTVQEFFDPQTEHEFTVQVFGFAGWQRDAQGQPSDGLNRRYRDRLMNDVYQLFVAAAGDEGIALYNEADQTLIGNGYLEIVRARARQIPVNALEIEAERYKFVVEADVSYVVG